MNALEIVSGVVLLIASILIILIVMLQSGRESNMSASFTGVADSYLGRNQSRTKEARLEKLTKILAIVFFIVALAANLVNVLVNK